MWLQDKVEEGDSRSGRAAGPGPLALAEELDSILRAVIGGVFEQHFYCYFYHFRLYATFI